MKTALVTGSSVRTGRAIGLHLAREGWRVVVHGRPGGETEAQDAARVFREAGGEAVVALADISTEAGCRELSEKIPDGTLDLLVHNVAAAGFNVPKHQGPWGFFLKEISSAGVKVSPLAALMAAVNAVVSPP